MTTLDAETQQALTAALYAYLHDYGGDSLDEARAIAGALLAVKMQAGELTLRGWEAEQWVEALVADVDLSQPPQTQTWQAVDQHLATQAKHWRDQLAIKTRAAVDAYLQKYTPVDTQDLELLVATVLPLVTDATMTRAEALHVIHIVSSQINLSVASDRVIDPKWLLLADQVHQVWQQRELESSVGDVMAAYIHKFQPAAVEITESLIEQAVEAVTNSRLKLGLEAELTPETRQLLIKQVMLKVKLRDASAPPTKTFLEMAQDIHDEVMRYRRDRGLNDTSYWPNVTTRETNDSSSALGGEMSVGIDLQPGTSTTEQSSNISSTDG